MNTLKEILVDAARYRWLRDQNAQVVGELNTFYVGQENNQEDFGWVGCDLDAVIDAELSKETS